MNKTNSLSKSGIGILGIPLDWNSSYLRGPAEAPDKIRQSLLSSASNLWTENGIDLGNGSAWTDAGNLNFDRRVTAFAEIETAAAEILNQSHVLFHSAAIIL